MSGPDPPDAPGEAGSDVDARAVDGVDAIDAIDADAWRRLAHAPVAARIGALARAAAVLGPEGRGSVDERLAAVGLLAGCVGRDAIAALVGAFDDAAARVRLAAVRALGASAGVDVRHAPRLLHALVHRRADVRHAALAEPALPASLLAVLLADPRLKDAGRDALLLRAAKDPSVGAAVVRARRNGVVDDDDARLVLRALAWAQAPATIVRALPCTRAPTAAIKSSATALTQHAVADGFDDALVDVVVLVGDDDDVARALIDAAARRALDDGDLLRVAVAVAIAAMSGAALCPRLIAVAALAAPSVLMLDAIDAELRRRALALLALAPPHVLLGRHDAVFGVVDVRADVFVDDDGGVDVVALAGALRLCSEKAYAQLNDAVAKSIGVPVVVRALSRALTRKRAPLLALPPTSGPDRTAYAYWVTSTKQALLASTATPQAWARVATDVPHDGTALLEGLEQAAPGLPLRVVCAIVDGSAHDGGGGDGGDGDDGRDPRRVERALATLAAQIPLASAGALLRVLATVPPRRARPALAAYLRAVDVLAVCVVVDGLIDAHQRALVPLLIDEAPPLDALSTPVSLLRALVVRTTSKTVQALIARGSGHKPVPLDDAEREALLVIAAPHLGAALLGLAKRGPRAGLAEAVLARPDVDALPRSPDGVAALLCSHDGVAQVARACAALLDRPTPFEWAGLRHVLRHELPPRALSLWGRFALVDDDDVALLVERDVRGAPGGLKGMIDLAVTLPSPLDAIVWRALKGTLRRLVAIDKDGARRLVDDRAARALVSLRSDEGGLLPNGSVNTDGRAAVDEFFAVAAPLLPSTSTSASATTAAATTAAAAATTATTHPLWEAAQKKDAAAIKAFFASVPAPPPWRARDDVGVDAGADAVHGLLLAGLLPPDALLLVLTHCPAERRSHAVLAALRTVESAAILTPLVRLLPLRLSTLTTVDRLRDLFSWGARQSIAIVGKPLSMSLIGDSLGYTRLKGHRVFVNPLPILLGHTGGVDVVKGLIVHELGHHRFHAGAEGLAVWEQAQRERMHQLLNLVCDEHLERNLRAQSVRYGHPLKVLAAYAFLHMEREIDIDTLLRALGRHALTVLIGANVQVARKPGAVVVDVGAALAALEASGSSFARFMRALRMGLGDRFDDEKVRAALALFSGKRFRQSDMPALMTIARKLREIFQSETQLLDAFDFHELTDASADDVVGDGAVDVDEMSRAAAEEEARAKPKRARSAGTPPKGAGRFVPGRRFNTDDDDAFDEITTIERVVHDASTARPLAARVRRDAERLRKTLTALGKNLVVERRRLAGRRLDRGALSGALLRGDPHLLVSRRILPAADVFIGVVIDCSGSMDGENLERAQLFGAVIAEAAKGLTGVDARFFGFTDDVIYDAGDARRCSVAGLTSQGGNNDAAALAHVARVARRSRRQTRLLVMISDGAPTECSVEALRALVVRLSRQGFLCAQVAVESLDEICFPHYVLLDGDDLRSAVRGFAHVVERLVLLGTGNHRDAGGVPTGFLTGILTAAGSSAAEPANGPSPQKDEP